MNGLAERLRTAMGAQTVKEVAANSGITEFTVYRVLSGRGGARDRTIFSLARALGVRALWLWDGTGAMKPKCSGGNNG